MAAPAGLDWEWALRTGGALSPAQKRRLLLPLARVVMRYPAARLRLATGRRGDASLDLDAVRFPDSALARAATEEAREVLSPYLLEHSFRTYLFGLLLAQLRAARIDEELVYVASMLHDTELEPAPVDRCFAVAGGERAHAFAVAHGADERMATSIGGAVAGHITVGAADDLGDPAGFVSAGAFADITGVGLEHAEPAWVDAVHRAHPRHDLRRQLLRLWRDAGRGMPDGRARWLTRYGAFPVLLRLAPFDE